MSTNATTIGNARYYRFINKGSSKPMTAASASNITTPSINGTANQVWQYFSGTLKPENMTSYTLSYQTGNRAILKTAPDSVNQKLILEQSSYTSKGYYYYIKLASRIDGKVLYLTRNSSNVLGWSDQKTNNGLWMAEEVRKVTNIPHSTTKTDYFATWSGFANSEYGSSRNTSIKNLHYKCFGNYGTNDTRNYNSYGQMYASSITSLKGKFHTGVDLSAIEGTPVLSPVSGTLEKSDLNYGTVAIKNSRGIFVFLHMKNRIAMPSSGKLNINEGQKIGEVGRLGRNGAIEFPPHLHVEVHASTGTFTGYDYQANSFEWESNLRNVHNYF